MKEIQGLMTYLQKRSESLDTEFPSLISRANALKQSKEQQGEHKKLEKSLNILEEKRKKLWLFKKHFSHSFY